MRKHARGVAIRKQLPRIKQERAVRRLEDDQDESGAFHGSGGPIPIRRATPADLHPVQAAFVEACRTLGFPTSADLNHPEAAGVGPWPMNVRDGIRISTAIGYLLPARRRPNLNDPAP